VNRSESSGNQNQRSPVVETRKEYGNVGPANVLLNPDGGAMRGSFRHVDKIRLFGQGSGMSVGVLLQWHGLFFCDKSTSRVSSMQGRVQPDIVLVGA